MAQNKIEVNFEPMIKRIDEATEILEAAEFAMKEINKRPGKQPATVSELTAAIMSSIVLQVIESQIDMMRDPDGYFSEEYHAE
ncbi:MAG: hypothetical protein WC898_02265 [Candidatus Paceibacterota bacterium]|jgi:hypothetical protein